MGKQDFDDGLWGELPCKATVVFSNIDEAHARILESTSLRGTAATPYLCRDCQQWHIGV